MPSRNSSASHGCATELKFRPFETATTRLPVKRSLIEPSLATLTFLPFTAGTSVIVPETSGSPAVPGMRHSSSPMKPA